MKILHVIPSIAPRYGGPSNAIYAMCQALQKQSAKPLIATTNADGAQRLTVPLEKELIYQQVKTIFFNWQWSQAFQYSRPLALWLQRRVADFDVVHIHAVFSHACLAAARACQKRKVPYIVRPLGSLDPWSMKQKRLRKKLFWNLGVKRMLDQAATIHYTATEEKRLAEESLGLARGVVIPLGFDISFSDSETLAGEFRAAHTALGDSPYILFLSRIHPKKGLELLLQTFLELKEREEFKAWKLVVAGDGESDYVAALKRSVQHHKDGKDILFVGWLEGDKKKSATRDAALLALPSHQENFGICIIEALASGVPVLVSPFVNLAGEIKDAAVGWIAGLEKTDFTNVLGEALGNPDERFRRGSRGREFARHFSATRMAEDLLTLYHSVIIRSDAERNPHLLPAS
jgi:glycosyltransferase involved in cell wall biosynthesis